MSNKKRIEELQKMMKKVGYTNVEVDIPHGTNIEKEAETLNICMGMAQKMDRKELGGLMFYLTKGASLEKAFALTQMALKLEQSLKDGKVDEGLKRSLEGNKPKPKFTTRERTDAKIQQLFDSVKVEKGKEN